MSEQQEEYKISLQNKQKEIYFRHGLDNQLEKLEEECLELALAIKHKDKLGNELFSDIIPEMADVLNLIEQFRDNNLYFKHGIENWKKYKVDREIDRINKND